MPLKLPTFSDPFLHGITICTYTDNDLFKVPDVNWDAKYEGDHWVHLAIGKEDEDGEVHFHVDIVRSFGPKKSPPNSNLRTIEDKLISLSGGKVLSRIRGIYNIPKEHGPKKGLIPAMSVSTEFDNETLTLTGAQIRLSGRPFMEIKWSLDVDEVLKVELEAFDDVVISDSFIRDAERLLRSGLDRYVPNLSEV